MIAVASLTSPAAIAFPVAERNEHYGDTVDPADHWRSAPGPVGIERRRRSGVADRVRECGQPAIGARDRTAARTGGVDGAGRAGARCRRRSRWCAEYVEAARAGSIR